MTNGVGLVHPTTYRGIPALRRYLASQDTYRKGSTLSESNLVKHAEHELNLIGEEPEVIEGYLKVVRAFADMGHSGGSAMVAIPVLNKLLQYQPLYPLTDDPEEWYYHDETIWGAPGGIWQNKRNGEAFSTDGGKTYTLLSDRDKPKPIHTSAKRKTEV